MNFLRKIFGLPPEFTKEQYDRLIAWRALEEPDLDTAVTVGRMVVVDVETSGLDVYNDWLIAIGAVEIVDNRLICGRSFYKVLRQTKVSSDDNIVIHGISGTVQTEGEDPVDALLSFLEYIGKATLIGYNAPFDDVMIRKALKQHLGIRFKGDWIDLAWLAPSLYGDRSIKPRGLDEWLRQYSIVNPLRHNALADAFVTAQLFMILKCVAAEKGFHSPKELIELARSQHLLAKQKL